ncbi:putative mitochondrial protein [Tanacetum coccineum]
MVNTGTNNLITNTPTPTYPIQAALAAIQETLANIQAEVRTHTTEIANLKRGEGTSQPRTGELTGQPRPHLEPNTPYGKLIKIEFPKFSGDKVKDWVYRSLVWYQQYMKKYPDNTLWEHFEVEVVKRFGVLYEDPIVELKNLKQTGSVQHYQEDFEALLNKVDLPEPIAVSMFIGGLKPEVGTPMRMFQANTLSESYQLARMQEGTNTILKPSWEMGWAIQCLANSWRIVKVKKLIMKFNHKGRQLVLRGMNNTHVHWMQGNEGFEAPSLARLSMALCVYPVQLCQMESAGSVSA